MTSIIFNNSSEEADYFITPSHRCNYFSFHHIGGRLSCALEDEMTTADNSATSEHR